MSSAKSAELIASLAPLQVNNHFYRGSIAARRLTRLAEIVQLHRDDSFVEALQEAAALLCDRSADGFQNQNQVKAATKSNPIWALATLPELRNGLMEPFLSLTLLRIVRAGPEYGIQARERCFAAVPTLRRLMQSLSDLGDVVRDLNLCTADILCGMRPRSDLVAFINELERQNRISFIARKALTALSFDPFLRGNDTVTRVHRLDREPPALSPAQPYVRGTLITEVKRHRTPASWIDQPELGVSPLTISQVPPASLAKTSRTLARAARHEHGLLQIGLLSEHSPEALSHGECRRIVDFLCQALHAGIAIEDAYRAQACLVWLLAGATGRATDRIIRALSGPAEESQPGAVRFSEGLRRWTTLLQSAEQCSRVRDNLVLGSIVTEAELPMPVEIREALEKFAAAGWITARRIDWVGPELVLGKCTEIQAHIRKSVCQRFSHSRWTLSMPIAVVANTGEPCMSQMAAGHRLGQSDAPLHYYAVSHSEFVAGYVNSMRDRCGWSFDDSAPETVAAPTFLGAATAMMRDDVFKQFSSTLKEEVKAAGLRSKGRLVSINLVNKITTYTAWMLAAAVGHRMTQWISEITLHDIDPRGWACLHDKETVGGGTYRPAILPGRVVRQIQLLMRSILQVIDDLEKEEHLPDSIRTALFENLTRRINGTGPLFQMISVDLQVGPLHKDSAAFAHCNEHQLPRNFLRSRLRMGLTAQSVHPRWIYWQLGHVYLSEKPLAEHGLDAVKQVADLLHAPIDNVLEKDGWCLTPSSWLNAKALPEWPPALDVRFDFESAGAEHLVKTKRDHASFNSVGESLGASIVDTPDRPDGAEVEAPVVHELESLEALTRRLSEQKRTGVQLTQLQSQLSSAIRVQLAAFATAADASQFLCMLRARLRPLLTNLELPLTLPETNPSQPYEPPPITPAHVMAARACHALRNEVIRQYRPGRLDAEQLLGGFALLIALEGQVGSAETLVRICNADILRRATALPDFPSRWLVKVMLGEGPDARSESRILSEECTLAGKRWLAHASTNTLPPATKEMVLSAVLTFLPSESSRSTLGAIVTTCVFASKIELPGVIAQSLCAIEAHTLTPERTFEHFGYVPPPELQERRGHAPESLAPIEHPWLHTPTPRIATEHSSKRLEYIAAAEANDIKGNYLLPAIKNFRALMAGISRLATKTFDGGTAHTAKSQMRVLLAESVQNQDQHPLITLLVEFGISLCREGRSSRPNTIQRSLSTLGRRMLLLSRGDPRILGAEELVDFYREVIHFQPLLPLSGGRDAVSLRASNLASLALKFHAANKTSLADADLQPIADMVSDRVSGAVRVGTVSPMEVVEAGALLTHLASEALISLNVAEDAKLVLAVADGFGLRAAETVQRRLRDVEFDPSGGGRLIIRASGMGTIKSRASRRPCELSLHGPNSEHENPDSVHEALAPVHSRRKADAKTQEEPLFDAPDGAYRTFLLDLVRRVLELVSTGKADHLHLPRHAKGSRTILDLVKITAALMASEKPPSPWQWARVLGHASPLTALDNYWHLGHVAHAIFWKPPLSNSQRASIEGLTPTAIAHRRVRGRNAEAKANEQRKRHGSASPRLDPDLISINERNQNLALQTIRPNPNLAPTLYSLLLDLCLGIEPERALPRYAVPTTYLRHLVDFLCKLWLSARIQLIPRGAIDQLARSYNSAAIPLPDRKVAALSISNSALRRALKRIPEPDAWPNDGAVNDLALLEYFDALPRNRLSDTGENSGARSRRSAEKYGLSASLPKSLRDDLTTPLALVAILISRTCLK